jgi:hypothetical protein
MTRGIQSTESGSDLFLLKKRMSGKLGGQCQNPARKISKLSVVLENHTSHSCLALSP